MEIRTIIAAVSGGTASPGVVDIGCRLARRFGSHVEGFHVRLDPRDFAYAAVDAFSTPIAGALMDRAVEDAAATANRARRTFMSALELHAIPTRDEPPSFDCEPTLLEACSAGWREDMGYSAVRLADRARLFDLMVLGRSGRVVDEPYSESIEEALLSTGRPALIAPVEPPRSLGKVVALAWNNSPESAKALSAAMPFLLRAQKTLILSLGETGAPELARHLAWYGIRASAVPVLPLERVGTGELLLAAARDNDADLLVMGGYGKAPWREWLFGGATRDIVGASLMPLLLAH